MRSALVMLSPVPGSEPNPALAIFVVLVVLGGAAWFISIIVRGIRGAEARIEAESAAAASTRDRAPLDDPDPEVQVEQTALDGHRSVDLRPLDSTRMVIRGTPNYVNYSTRGTWDSTHYVLTREPSNRHDTNAVAVLHPSGRKLGYISRTRAASMAPLLDRIGPAVYVVSGGMDDGRLRVDLPLLPGLRTYVKTNAQAS